MPATNIGLRPCPILQRVTHGPAAGHLTIFWTAFPWRSAMQQTRHCCKTYHQEWSRSPQGKGGPAVTPCPEWEWTPTHPPEMCSRLFFCTNLSPQRTLNGTEMDPEATPKPPAAVRQVRVQRVCLFILTILTIACKRHERVLSKKSLPSGTRPFQRWPMVAHRFTPPHFTLTASVTRSQAIMELLKVL